MTTEQGPITYGTTERAYTVGTALRHMPVAVIPEHAADVDGGPVRFVVESRFLADDVVTLALTADEKNVSSDILDDGGASVHVFGAEDGLEHLRFDCFDKHPHYHYVNNDEQLNLVVRFDETACGDPLEWTIGRLRDRLAEMLDFAGAANLAGRVRDQQAEVQAGVDGVDELLAEANSRARSRRAADRGA